MWIASVLTYFSSICDDTTQRVYCQTGWYVHTDTGRPVRITTGPHQHGAYSERRVCVVLRWVDIAVPYMTSQSVSPRGTKSTYSLNILGNDATLCYKLDVCIYIVSTVVSFRRGKVVREFARTDRTQAGSFLHSLLEICDASLFVGEDDSFRLSSSLHNILHNVVLYPICA